MKFAYADPPYFGCCALYGHDHRSGCWDDGLMRECSRGEDYMGELRRFLEELLTEIRDPDRLGRGMGTDLPYAYDLPPQQARDLLRRIRNALAREDGAAAEARLRTAACPRCSTPGSLTFHNGGGTCPLVRTDDEVPLCRPEDT